MYDTDLTAEEVSQGHGIYLAAACNRFPPHRQGRPVTLGCLVRWICDGVKAVDGQRVKLGAVRLAGRWITSPQAIQRFVAAQTPRLADGQRPRSPAKRKAAAERAEAELKQLGI